MCAAACRVGLCRCRCLRAVRARAAVASALIAGVVGVFVSAVGVFAVGVFAVGLSPRPAAASPLEDPNIGGAVFTGPLSPHAPALTLNPAALGLAASGNYFSLSGSFRFDRYRIERQTARYGEDGGCNASELCLRPGPTLTPTTTVPGLTMSWYKVGQKISLGAALSWADLDRYVADEPALQYHSFGGHYRQATPLRVPDGLGFARLWLPAPSVAVSYVFNRRLRVGVGVTLRWSAIELDFWRDTALEQGLPGIESDCAGSPCNIENPVAAERYRIQANTPTLLAARNLVLNGGFLYRFIGDWWFAVHYQSPPGFLSSVSLAGIATITPAERDRRSGDAQVLARAEVIFQLPQTISAGVRGPAFGRYDVVASARWQTLARHRLLDIRLLPLSRNPDNPIEVPERLPLYRGLSDVWTGEVGLEQRESWPYKLGPDWFLRTGLKLRIESQAADDAAISPMQVEGFHLSAALGAEIGLRNFFSRVLRGNDIVLSGSYGLSFYPQVEVGDSVYDPADQIACVDSGFALDRCIASAEGRARPTAAGTYERLRHALRIAVRYHFY